MAVQEYIFDEQGVPYEQPVTGQYTAGARSGPYVTGERDNTGFFHKCLTDGTEGRPEVWFAIKPPGFENPAHFHNEVQFQVLLEGSISFPGHSVEAIGVHYTDINTPYGPSLTGPNLKEVSLRLRPPGEVRMSDPVGRKYRDPNGRELFGQSKDVPWENLSGHLAGVKRKFLFGKPGEQGPKAQIWTCPPNSVTPLEAAPFGEYYILLEGSASVGEDEMKPHSVRFVIGDDPPMPLTSGSNGSSWFIATLDQTSQQPGPLP